MGQGQRGRGFALHRGCSPCFGRLPIACGQQRFCPRNRIRGDLNIAGFASLHLFLRLQIKLNDLRVGCQTPTVKCVGRHACADAQNNLGPLKNGLGGVTGISARNAQ